MLLEVIIHGLMPVARVMHADSKGGNGGGPARREFGYPVTRHAVVRQGELQGRDVTVQIALHVCEEKTAPAARIV